MSPSISKNIKQSLHAALEKIGSFEQCALLDHPGSPNIGDHLIWLGSISYLTEVLQAKINYAATKTEFNSELMEKKIGKAPIIILGGGNLGDLWDDNQLFRENIISKYRNQPIIILPQTIYFKNEKYLKKAADVFNSHPNLTLFTRDRYSYEIALSYFHSCQIIKAPDMAFQLVGMPGLNFATNSSKSVLYHCRQDKETPSIISDNFKVISDLVTDDWVSYKYKYGQQKFPLTWVLAKLYRECWQRGLAVPFEWIHRQKWQRSHPYNTKFEDMHNPSIHCSSLSLMHSGIYQFNKYRFIITNRLHGHIICVLLAIPHIFLPNSYYKNEAFYETWTKEIPFGKFVKDVTQIEDSVEELIKELSSDDWKQKAYNHHKFIRA